MIEGSMHQAYPSFSPRKRIMSAPRCQPGFPSIRTKPEFLMTLRVLGLRLCLKLPRERLLRYGPGC